MGTPCGKGIFFNGFSCDCQNSPPRLGTILVSTNQYLWPGIHPAHSSLWSIAVSPRHS